MPIHELYQLARFYNQSLVVENAGTKRLGNSDKTEEFEFDGMGRYFIDVGSSVTHRTKGMVITTLMLVLLILILVYTLISLG